MPRGFGKFSVLAYVSASPEEKKLPSGDKVSTVRLGVPRRQKDSDQTLWDNLRVTFWGDWPALAYLEPGRQVYVEGRLSPRSWEDGEGQKRYSLDLVAQELVLLGNGKSREPEAEQNDFGDDDIPF